MYIGGLQKLTLIDYPSKVAATVFLCGCDFRCPWCYNSELVLFHPVRKNFSNGARIPKKTLFSFLKERKGLLEGVCLTGGEPTINKDLPEFIRKIKKLGFLVKLDTNGSNPEMLKKLISGKLIDYAAMDVKAPLKSQKYNKAAGVKVNLNKIKKSIEIIKNSGIDYEFRTTAMPQIHSKEDIIEIAKAISPAKKYFLQNFRPEKTLNPLYEKCKPFNQKKLELIQKECNKYAPTKLRS